MQDSIHPRNHPGGNGEKLNTSKSPRPETAQRAIKGIEGHLERHPNDVKARAQLKNIQARA